MEKRLDELCISPSQPHFHLSQIKHAWLRSNGSFILLEIKVKSALHYGIQYPVQSALAV